MLYMFLLHWNEQDPSMTSEEAIAAHFAFAKEARVRGSYVASEAIGGTAVATTVRVRDGNRMITDGPYAETKEFIGGFWVISAPDLDVALKLAADGSKHCNRRVEVRPFL